MKKLLAPFVALILFVLAGVAAPPAARAQLVEKEPLDRIIAIAEEDVILQSELDRAVANVLAQYRANPQQLPPRKQLEEQVLQRLIMMHLQVQRAQSTGIRVSDTDVDQAMQRVAENNKIDVRQLRASLERDGLSFDDFRKNLHDQLMVQRLQQRVVQNQVNVTDSEVNILLASNSLKSGEVHLQHILLVVPEGADAAQIQTVRAKADNVKKEIDGGMDFTAAAIRYSNAEDALQGGDLGWRRFDEVPEAFANLVDGMQPGQVSQVLRGPSGFHIVKLVDKRATGKQVVTEFHARHILIKTSELVSSDDALRTITDIRHRIVDGGEDFAKLAKQHSEDAPSANSGGDLGWFPIEQYGSRVAEVVSSLKDNEISQPFQTDAGWHILQRLGERKEDRTDDMMREQARDVLRNRKAEEEYENFLRQVRSESYVCAVNSADATPDLPLCADATKEAIEKKAAP
ncbi:MAG TPA: peptidylprolyl isomerase [Rudaea sp.]|nr:peptidylprolyl isomerase [Rudaea sp.]